jgi:hypothetical protein
MGIQPLGHFIQIPNIVKNTLNLHSGEITFVNVIKELVNGKWAVGIKGTVFSARSSVELHGGETIAAFVVKDGNRIILKLLAQDTQQFTEILKREGLAHDPLTVLIISSLLKSNIKIEDSTIRNARFLLERLKGDPKRNARILSLLLSKGIIPDGNEIPSLFQVIDYGSEDTAGKRKEEREKQKQIKREKIEEDIKKAIQKTGPENRNPLVLFNHLSSVTDDDNWIVAPYQIDCEGKQLKGTLRFLFDRRANKVLKMVIVTQDDEGNRLQFLLQKDGKEYKMIVYSNQKRLNGISLRRWGENILKLSKLGVKCDDIIHDDVNFNGFEAEQNEITYRSIDTEG